MVLIWNDIHSFRRHLENMSKFRQSHTDPEPAARLRLLEETIFQSDETETQSHEEAVAHSFTDTRGKAVLMPIWEINPPSGSQN
ncbi:MAG: hypothetical protein ABR886_04335 [Dehalococcoidales bacterium]|jgi:hypothetical protein